MYRAFVGVKNMFHNAKKTAYDWGTSEIAQHIALVYASKAQIEHLEDVFGDVISLNGKLQTLPENFPWDRSDPSILRKKSKCSS